MKFRLGTPKLDFEHSVGLYAYVREKLRGVQMASAIDPSKPADGIPAVKLDLRNNLQAARDEIEALQAGKTDAGHQHVLADISDAGALAGKSVVAFGDIANGAVTSAALGDAAVIGAKLADGAVTAAKIAPAAVGADQLADGIPIDMQDAVLRSPELRDFAETSPAATIASGVLTLDFEAGSVFEVAMTQNVSALNLVNPPLSGRAGACTLILRQDGTGGRTLAWPGAVRWPGGLPPTITAAPNAVDVISLVTRDGGATWFGFPSGQNFS